MAHRGLHSGYMRVVKVFFQKLIQIIEEQKKQDTISELTLQNTQPFSSHQLTIF